MGREASVKRNLLDAGCSDASAVLVDRLVQSGRISDALHEMRVLRCELVDQLHQSQRRVDCLDYLIRQTEKDIKVNTERRQQA